MIYMYFMQDDPELHKIFYGKENKLFLIFQNER